ncbi:hypothetical protein [Natranaerobius trueperi]|uniref:Uncharacterized protein n=1 Tax=Natranaerobius trueperi TaxID=759412 RepID=A0A226BZ76_9FIRM|nr:hypothetical protein [Natranaerobius trueperi]OWZ83624.1 hypothetical protein CDO51_07285 [Natranaerobius trueperi]
MYKPNLVKHLEECVAANEPIIETCSGRISLSQKILEIDRIVASLDLLNIEDNRNEFGSQDDSCK